MSNLEESWLFANQRHAIQTQLDDGVRALMLDTKLFEGVAHLCHGLCDAGKLPLAEGLGRIRTFLDNNQGEVVTLIFESYVAPEATAEAFVASGLEARVYTHPPGAPWPTLRKMIDDDTRVVVMTDDGGGTYGWYHNVWDLAFETHWNVQTRSDMSCNKNRGDGDNALFILNHFMSNPVASERWANEVNFNPFFIDRARACEQARGHLPNFVTVDFYSIGDVMNVVDDLNGVN